MNTDRLKVEFENRKLKQEVAILKKRYDLLDTNNKTLSAQFEARVKVKSKELTKDYKELLKIAKSEIKAKADIIESLNQRIEKIKTSKEQKINELNEEIIELKEKVIELTKQLNLTEQERDNYLSKINLNSNTSGIPTSKTAIGSRKKIPTTREKSNKNIGGQEGHKKHKLQKFSEEEINEEEYVETTECTYCGSHNLEETSKYDIKDELDYEIKIIKKRYYFKNYICKDCQKRVKAKIPYNLKEENQYGNKIQSLAISLVNIGNMPFNKVRKIIRGITGGEINLSEGYIAKLQKRAAENLKEYEKELYLKTLKLPVLHWDDTVIYINGKQGILRFYGDKEYAYYVAHERKNKEGIDKDNILPLLPKETKVVHDHNTVNYNGEYNFQNCECCQHLERDLEGVTINLPQRTWSKKLKNLFQNYNEKRNKLIEENKSQFSEEEILEFFVKLNEYILLGTEENEKGKNEYYAKEKERPLINRLMKYRDNYTYWLYDFEIPYTNNTAERGLRIVKSKMKTSGQFKNLAYASYYATIKSYIETCYRNGENEVQAIQRLMEGNPITINELENKNKED